MDTDTLAHLGASRQHSPIRLFARPYGMWSRRGFYFTTLEEFSTQAYKIRNRWGNKHVKFEIQFLDGNGLDAGLFIALCINENNLAKFFNVISDWSDPEKIDALILATGYGSSFKDIEKAIARCRAMERLNVDLYIALRINKNNRDKFFDAIRYWSNQEKREALISATECGSSFEDIEKTIAYRHEMELELELELEWERVYNY